MRWWRPRLRQGALLSLLVLGTATVGMRIAMADHFTDVPSSSPIHRFVEWLVNRGITAGCGSGLFCPDSPVTRGQMAVFMNTLGIVVTPSVLQVESAPGALDIDTNPVVCPTTVDHTPTYPQQAVVHARATVSAAGAGVLHATVFAVSSTNGGVSWTPLSSNTDRVYTTLAGEWSSATDVDRLDLTPGTNYRFAVQLLRQAGTVDASASRCEVFVEILNRNPPTSPFLTEPAAEAPSADTSK